MLGQIRLRDKSLQWKMILMIFPLCVLCIFLAILSFIPCVLLYRNNAAFDLDITHALEASLLQSSIFWGEWVKIFKRCAGYHTFGVLVLCPDYSWPWSPPASANHINFGPKKYKTKMLWRPLLHAIYLICVCSYLPLFICSLEMKRFLDIILEMVWSIRFFLLFLMML